MKTPTLIRLTSALAATFGLFLSAGPAAAQQQLERVEITGSNIRRTDAETASPVQVIARDEIERSGKASVAEFLQTLAVDNQGSVPSSFGGGFAAGASGISLRGLGAASTLVLLNGRRVAPYGLADDGQKVFADLNLIPMQAVERVEILKDGASAIYGSDAIAGVVNVILRREFAGTTLRASAGRSGKADGAETRASITHGFGNLEDDKYNLLLNFEFGRKNEIAYRDRAGRGAVGRNDLRDLGFSAQEGLGGTGAILDNNLAGSAINGNVRNPVTLDYINRGAVFPGAACSNFTNHPQGDPLGGCLIDGSQVYNQIQPSQQTLNFFGRGTLQINPQMQAYGELNLYSSRSESSQTPSGVSGSVVFPGGPVSNAGVSLGADHPDNPFTGSAARLRYLAADVGPRTSDIDSKFVRFVGGLKGTLADWDYDSAFLHSENRVDNTRGGFLQRDVAFALLNPTAANVAAARAGSAAYAALPTGTIWRIAENAGLNSAAMYAALAPEISSEARSKTTSIDFKASREIGQLQGGAMGLALGAEFRRESVELSPTTGTERGNVIGLGYSAYGGARNVAAAYAELAAPVLKTLELSAALRVDRYSDVGNAFTPKVGFKWTPVQQLALRGTYAHGFRAPSAAENGNGGLGAFAVAADPVRCNLGVASACNPSTVAVFTAPNPALEPEKSRSVNLGLIFEPMAGTSISADVWQIVRKNEINQEELEASIAAGKVARDPSTAIPTVPGDPGAIIAVLGTYVNSAQTTVRGVDIDLRQRFNLAEAGKLSFGLQYTHLFTWERQEQDGSRRDFAGTHGNCDVTNCMGTPDHRANFSASYETGPWRIGANLNYRGAFDNTLFKNDPDGCAFHFADGSDAPRGCKIGSFTTVDLNLRWQPSKQWQVFATIANLFDKLPPLDPLTYGAQGYNPLDHSGAVGRYFTVGGQYQF